jgi:hypothetical protein
MTATETAPPTDAWAAQLEQLRARYKHVRPPILAALNILVNDKDISVDDAKARASLHGVRITAASIAAAQTLLSWMDSPAVAAPRRSVAPAREPRRRAPETPVDAESLVRGFVEKLQGERNAEGERLREAIQQAITVLKAALGAP